MSLSSVDFFDLIDTELEEYIHSSATSGEALDNIRQAIARMYEYEYSSLKNLYGTSDDVGFLVDEDILDAPLGEEREVRPYLPPTQQTETGFVGLDAPLA